MQSPINSTIILVYGFKSQTSYDSLYHKAMFTRGTKLEKNTLYHKRACFRFAYTMPAEQVNSSTLERLNTSAVKPGHENLGES